ncbi:hypothetical protein ACE6ED_25600 [Paenibacillus sp. CN-4]|uniref:hypothetical protein n=1 Tax=Paenibacillus nanchangensis TaxID=3348343 RepID=UPI00397A3512
MHKDHPTEQQYSQTGYEDPLLRKHSGPGVASFVIALAALLGYIATFAIFSNATGTIFDADGYLTDESGQYIKTLGLMMMGLSALNVIGVVIGIIGLALKNRRKILAVIGTLINGVIILTFMVFVSIFLANAGAA